MHTKSQGQEENREKMQLMFDPPLPCFQSTVIQLTPYGKKVLGNVFEEKQGKNRIYYASDFHMSHLYALTSEMQDVGKEFEKYLEAMAQEKRMEELQKVHTKEKHAVREVEPSMKNSEEVILSYNPEETPTTMYRVLPGNRKQLLGKTRICIEYHTGNAALYCFDGEDRLLQKVENVVTEKDIVRMEAVYRALAKEQDKSRQETIKNIRQGKGRNEKSITR